MPHDDRASHSAANPNEAPIDPACVCTAVRVRTDRDLSPSLMGLPKSPIPDNQWCVPLVSHTLSSGAGSSVANAPGGMSFSVRLRQHVPILSDFIHKLSCSTDSRSIWNSSS